MDTLSKFIRLELLEGKRLNAAAMAAFAAASPLALRVADDERSRQRIDARVSDPASPVAQRADVPTADPVRADQPSTDLGKASTSTVSQEKRRYSRKELLSMIKSAADEENVSPAFVDAIAKVESNYNPYAVSHAGAQGMMQFIPGTAKMMKLDDPFDPKKAARASAKLLKKLLDYYDGDYDLAAAAYNAGRGNVDKYGGVPPFEETQGYVKKVAKAMAESQFNDEGSE